MRFSVLSALSVVTIFDMSESNAHQDLLRQLRDAAEARDPERCQFLLKTLFMDLDFYLALAVVIERAQLVSWRPSSTYYPDWRLRAADSDADGEHRHSALSLAAGSAARLHSTRAAANYMKALSDLAHALQPGPLPPRIGYSGGARPSTRSWRNWSSSITDRAWMPGRKYGAAPAEPVAPEAREIAYAFWTDEEVALLDTDHWLSLADGIEAAAAAPKLQLHSRCRDCWKSA